MLALSAMNLAKCETETYHVPTLPIALSGAGSTMICTWLTNANSIVQSSYLITFVMNLLTARLKAMVTGTKE